MLESLKVEVFARQLKTKFLLHPDPPGAPELELVEVSDDGEQAGFESFSLIFRGPLQTLLPQRIYRMEHAELGAFELFIVPIKQDQEGFYYQAIINRRIP